MLVNCFYMPYPYLIMLVKFGYPFIHAGYVFAFVWFLATCFHLLLLLINSLMHDHIQQFDSCSCVNHVNPS